MDSYQDLDVAEDIIFRPLFRYRQEEQEKLSQKKNYQPYIYAYKKPKKYTSRQYYSNDY